MRKYRVYYIEPRSLSYKNRDVYAYSVQDAIDSILDYLYSRFNIKYMDELKYSVIDVVEV